MSNGFQQVLQAWNVQDPALVDMLVALTKEPDPKPTKPISDDELTFERFLQTIFHWSFKAKHPNVQFAERVAMIAKLEADEGVYPLPDRYKIHILLIMLWEDGSPYARSILLSAIDALPLSYGVWKGLKRIFKEAEQKHDYEVFAHITAKIDCERYNQRTRSAVSLATKTYISLRAWRFLRNIGRHSSWLYPHVASQVLACYPEDFNHKLSWVLNHICFHEGRYYQSRLYTSRNFSLGSSRTKQLFHAKERAFTKAWRLDPKPLLDLLLTANNEAIRQFATDSLKHDFDLELRDVSVNIIQQLSAINSVSNARDELIVWLLTQSPNFAQVNFKKLGLHDVVIKLLFSNFEQAHQYACDYAKSYAPNLPFSTLLFLSEHKNAFIRQFAIEKILALDPRKEVGIEGWRKLLVSHYHHQIATKQLILHFNRRDFSPAWFFECLLSNNRFSIEFASKHLTHFYRLDELGVDYFIRLVQHLPNDFLYHDSMDLALEAFKQLGVSKVAHTIWQILLLHPLSRKKVQRWIDSDVIHTNSLSIDFWQAIAYEPDWQSNHWIQTLITPSQDDLTTWQHKLAFDYSLASWALSLLADVRRFTSASLSLSWLMKLIESDDSHIRQFAIERINKGFIPADFLPANHATLNNQQTSLHHDVDLHGQSFLFTGKMATMPRAEAENLVKNANGKISSTVSAKLTYLVIGDEGSPFYGNGRKGSKQVKAESLNTNGATIKIISETAFLQMLSGQNRQTDESQTLAGAEIIWQMAVSKPDAPASHLAIYYLRHHHEKLCMELTDRPVDPDAVIPNTFFSAERIIPLLSHGYQKLREFAIQIVKHELTNWQVSPQQWLMMAESPYHDVHTLLTEALLADVSIKNHHYHQDVDKLSASMLYSLIDSRQYFARQLGITLLSRYPQFHEANTLYHLTESTDREVRYASVKMLWKYYRETHIPKHWQAKHLTNEQTAKPKADRQLKDLPAEPEQLLLLLKRGLFELPPSRLTQYTVSNNEPQNTSKLKFISASHAKVALIETFRDVALNDESFAHYVLPSLQNFIASSGKMERHACLVAVTRILHRYPNLANSNTMAT